MADSSTSDSPLTVVFAGGGSGGHLYPALSIAAELHRRVPDARVVFYGTGRAIDDRILSAVRGEFVRQDVRPLSNRPWRWPGFAYCLYRERRSCRARFFAARPDVVIGTGGFASAPAVREAARAGIPCGLLNPDCIPGKANRYLAPHVNAVFAQWEETAAFWPNSIPVVVSGCPIRQGFADATRESGIRRFELDPTRRTILVTGASQGARTINQAIVANAEFLAAYPDWQVLHLTGDADFEAIRAAWSSRGVVATVLAYTEHMAEALAAADLVVSRAGASTLAEITAKGRASILFPYPFDKDRHQTENAKCLERRGAAVVIDDEIESERNAPKLRDALGKLMGDRSGAEALATAARRMARPDAASVIVDALLAWTRTAGGADRRVGFASRDRSTSNDAIDAAESVQSTF